MSQGLQYDSRMLLEGKTGIIFGVANKRSIAWAIALRTWSITSTTLTSSTGSSSASFSVLITTSS